MGDTGLDAMRMHSYEELQTWLASDEEVRDELEVTMGSELGIDEESLDPIEAFLLARYRTPDDLLAPAERGVLDAVARHIGLVMILAIDGAKWSIELSNHRNVYYQLPIIKLPDGAEECPLTLATASIDRRAGNYLRTVIGNYMEDYDK